MAQKYKYIEDESMMLSEPNVALKYHTERSAAVLSMSVKDDIIDAISGEELKKRLHESLRARFA